MSQFRPILLIVSISLLLSGCNNEAKTKALTRTWRIDNMKFSKPVPPGMEGFFEQKLQELRLNLRTTYRADGTYTDSIPGKTMKGKWQFSKDETKLIITDEGGMSNVYNITNLTNDSFVYDQFNQGDKISMIFVPGSIPVKPVKMTSQPAPTNSVEDTLVKK